MKKVLIGLFIYLVLPMQVLAGYYGGSRVDEYDPNTGIYYKAMEIERESRIFISKGPSTQVTNISIFIPETEKHRLLFEDRKKRDIVLVLYETGMEDGVMQYNMPEHYRLIKNNRLVANRPPRDKLLIGVRVEKDEEYSTELWLSDKHGNDLKLLTEIPATHDWHIDVRNSKIRIVFSNNGEFSQKSVEW